MDAQALLRSLAAQPGQMTQGRAPIQQQNVGDFAALLQAARAGDVRTGIRVSVARDANVTLNEDQLARLSAAADQAEAHGISRGLFLIDGQMVTMDVGVRIVVGQVQPSQAGVVSDVDGVINVPPAGDGSAAQASAGSPGQLPQSLALNAALLRALAQGGAAA